MQIIPSGAFKSTRSASKTNGSAFKSADFFGSIGSDNGKSTNFMRSMATALNALDSGKSASAISNAANASRVVKSGSPANALSAPANASRVVKSGSAANALSAPANASSVVKGGKPATAMGNPANALITGNSEKSTNFMSAMADGFSAVDKGENFSVSSAAALEGNGPLVESPYSRHTTNGVTYTLSEVCFTKSELKELRDELIKAGAPEAALKQFDILASQPDGATMAQVMASLMGTKSNIQISESDAQSITALLGQIDPSGKLAEDALDFMRNGHGYAALEMIQASVAAMDPAETISVDRDEIMALGRGLGLDNGSVNGLLINFGGKSSLTLAPAQFDVLMGPAKSQLMEEQALAQKLDEALDTTLKPIIAKARNRMEKEKAASALQDRRVEQSRILIDKTVQEKSRAIIEDTATGETGENSMRKGLEALERQAQDKAHASSHEINHGQNSVAVNGERQPRQPDTGANTTKGANSQTAKSVDNPLAKGVDNQADALKEKQNFANEQARADADSKTGRQETQGQTLDSGLLDQRRDGGREQGDSPWSELLGKIQESRPVQTINVSAATAAMTRVEQNLENAVMAPPEPVQPPLASHLASQVERGVLTAMRDGATRLDLQLHPAELGTIAITLVARNGELTAQIRSEKSETTEMLNQQLDTIRINLEQQGIKVDKLEVALDNSRNDFGQDAFQDLQQHNAWQEENARRQELARRRNLAGLRVSAQDAENSAIDQAADVDSVAARYAGKALNVVA